jgi:hypothetical protein
MLTLTAEQVRTLAPDSSAARAGEALGDRRRWSGTGRTDTAAWGLCQGSGSSPYQAVVDLSGPAYKCSCPSRKIPCKHCLGLLFLLADGGIAQESPPDGARTWLEARATRAAAAGTKAETAVEVDPAARARRVESREKKVAAGIAELDRWLTDLMRRGLDSARAEGYRFWDDMGARLVDAQAGGLGRSVRALGSAASAGEAWPHVLLEGAGRLHLLCEAYRRADQLPDDLRADVRSLVGWTTKEDELNDADAVDDRWLVVGRRVDDSGQVITARTFLLGESSKRPALHLAFGVGAAPPTALAMPGQAFRATLAFYPSATPLRAAVRPTIVPDGEVTAVPETVGLDEVVGGHAARLSRNPFLAAWPSAIHDVVPVRRDGRLLVRDADGNALPVTPTWLGPRLLAISGGHPVTLVAEWDGTWLRPLSAVAGGRLAAVSGSEFEATAETRGDTGWSQLVSAALLGTERSGGTVPVPQSVASLVTGAEPERALLAAAGSITVRRRAARRTALDEAPMPAAAELDARPSLSGSVARLLGLVVVDQPALVPEFLGLVPRSRRLPDEWLPDLLELASRSDAVRDALAGVAGPRAAWLAAALPELDTGGTVLGVDPDEAWDAATSATARVAVIRAMRRDDPAAARDALARWLPDVAGDERARILGSLEVGLEPADEPLLAGGIGDRRLDVRRTAAGLLVRLPGSALTRRLEEYVRPLLASQGRLRPSLSVTLPTIDADLEGAGFGGKPPQGFGERAWLLRGLFAHVRPGRWVEWLATDASGLIDRALRSDEARPVLEGWILATERFGDRDWASALLRAPDVRTKVMVNVGQVLEGLDPAGRATVLAETTKQLEPQMLAAFVEGVPAPWPQPLAEAVLGVTKAFSGSQYPDQALYQLVRAAAIGLPPRRAEDLETLASYQGQIRPALDGAIETIRLRARIHDAFAILPPA